MNDTTKPNRATRRQMLRELEEQSGQYTDVLVRVPPADWPDPTPPTLIDVWRSRAFLVQVFEDVMEGVLVRLSVCRAQANADLIWKDNITWDELQLLKGEAGYADKDAVEVYPAARDLVNVANMRHLWVMESPVPFAWRRPPPEQTSLELEERIAARAAYLRGETP